MKVIPSIFITLSVILISPNAVAQVANSDDFNALANTSSRDLTGIESRSAADWPWAVGGEYSEPQESLPLDSTSLDLDYYDAKLENLNNTYEPLDRQLGDVERPTSRFPFAQF
ncbi:hypothetical protein VB715_12505 [Crocosphaera sp. UHCC 0190]|uniref:hypothetical protein n=1 Tax=Crocosphaera sp. UHCC 0190 TaxID=3110246 RepID=UPI002B20E147|nr:hypothetical protein [Crocosphaera sp. UHCC 0190]MEA5510587.1 hypothetical protein [Crocosphaera sp. UHCC 0190]